MRLARQAAPYAGHRLIALMDSEDERVAAVACNAILDRAFGKPGPAKEEKDDMAGPAREYDPGGAVGGNAEASGDRAAVFIGPPKTTAAIVTVRRMRVFETGANLGIRPSGAPC